MMLRSRHAVIVYAVAALIIGTAVLTGFVHERVADAAPAMARR